MNRTRRLTLRRETLADLATTELRAVPGGSGPGGSCGTCITQCDCPTLEVRQCLSLGPEPCIS